MGDYRLQCRPVSLDQVKLILEIAADEVGPCQCLLCRHGLMQLYLGQTLHSNRDHATALFYHRQALPPS
jgi:hypothetical protein